MAGGAYTVAYVLAKEHDRLCTDPILGPPLRLPCAPLSADFARSPMFREIPDGMFLFSGSVSGKRTTGSLRYAFSQREQLVDQ